MRRYKSSGIQRPWTGQAVDYCTKEPKRSLTIHGDYADDIIRLWKEIKTQYPFITDIFEVSDWRTDDEDEAGDHCVYMESTHRELAISRLVEFLKFWPRHKDVFLPEFAKIGLITITCEPGWTKHPYPRQVVCKLLNYLQAQK